MVRKRSIFAAICSLIFSGCVPMGAPASSFSIVNWNVQTFFDGNNDGIEYSEFRKSSGWNVEAYKKRLKQLCDSIKEMDADIFVFEELENSSVLRDISNQLAGSSWNQRKFYGHGCFAKNQGDAIGCGVLSRFPIEELTVHNIDVRTEGSEQPSARPIMKITVTVGERKVVLFVNHWKSKSGGEEESECWRNWQENVLSGLFGGCRDFPALATGDFNRDISEFSIIDMKELQLQQVPNVRLRKIPENEEEAAVFSPWIKGSGNKVSPGSYYYDSSWERIDHFFCNSKILISDFSPVTDGPWCDDDFIPKGYKVYTGSGYSDHLPVKCTVNFSD